MTLRTRLQSAPAGNRELDAELALALGWQSDNAMWWRGDDRSTWELGPPRLTTDLTAIVREILALRPLSNSITAAAPLALCVALHAALNPETDDAE